MAKIRGSKELKAAIRRAGPDLRKEATAEVRKSTKQMHTTFMMLLNSAASYAAFWHGKPGMQNITGTARRSYRWSVSENRMSGRVGLLTPASERRAFHLGFFLYGTVHQPARNAHDDAFERERDVFIQNQGQALARVLRKI